MTPRRVRHVTSLKIVDRKMLMTGGAAIGQQSDPVAVEIAGRLNIAKAFQIAGRFKSRSYFKFRY